MTSGPPTVLERHQVPLYLAALVVGALVGVAAPGFAGLARAAVTPALALLLYATFLGVPLTRLGAAVRRPQLLIVLLVVNMVLIPPVAWLLTRPLAAPSGPDPGAPGAESALLIGAAIVLLTPCVDYVVVFTRLAGGDAPALLAATPVLMLAQVLLLPLQLAWLVGPGVLGALDPGPFLTAFGLLIVLPLTAAWLTQGLHRPRPPRADPPHGADRPPDVDRPGVPARLARGLMDGADAAMVPLMMLVLALVVASRAHDVVSHATALLGLVPLYLGFAAVAAGIGLVTGRAARLDVPARRAVVFSAVTRNSLVVLPLAVALPPALDLASLAVVTQTMVELLVMVVLVRWRGLIPERADTPPSG